MKKRELVGFLLILIFFGGCSNSAQETVATTDRGSFIPVSQKKITPELDCAAPSIWFTHYVSPASCVWPDGNTTAAGAGGL